VLNHTSDQHPWFQRARRAAPGSSERDFYVWSDSPDKYGAARVIFQDYEGSNWAWDPVADAYFWHRFYAHQPDLNYENPAVREAMFEVVDHWLELGVDGLRLDAVPYIAEGEGTSSENLVQTHQVLKNLRQRIDARYPDRMLLAEANQWPEDAAAYFGDGDECQMAFHFPLTPRLFMALRGCLERGHRANRTVIRRLIAREIHASSVSGSTSYSLRNRRYRPSQAKVRSTTQRRGNTWKPVGRSGGGSSSAGTRIRFGAWRTTATAQPRVSVIQVAQGP